MAFLSTARRDDIPTAADFSKNLLILVNERLLGDGLATPRLRFQQGKRERDFSVQSDDGWHFDTHYKEPWLREMYRKFMHGDTWESPPSVDFIEQFVEAVRFNRPDWMVAPERDAPDLTASASPTTA
jgi:hypothetical protein